MKAVRPWRAPARLMMGVLGGLMLSAMKRRPGAKDWGVMIEVHGVHIVRFF
jgi:predicted CDP-diglyceride synthetase/phosphatidate cytidylyltransferase